MLLSIALFKIKKKKKHQYTIVEISLKPVRNVNIFVT